MYAVEVRDHVMIAHSLAGDVFGPAQRLHGATYVIDVAFFRSELDRDNLVVDIGRAHEALRATLKPLDYTNLDTLPELVGRVTSTEFLARYIFDRMHDAIRAGKLGDHAGGLERVRVTLNESHLARAWYEGSIDPV
jgi:6-pyruvoyl-tetrahydropterin synthase